ncbi:unnamed protein product, partial [Lampetra planeri]
AQDQKLEMILGDINDIRVKQVDQRVSDMEVVNNEIKEKIKKTDGRMEEMQEQVEESEAYDVRMVEQKEEQICSYQDLVAGSKCNFPAPLAAACLKSSTGNLLV